MLEKAIRSLFENNVACYAMKERSFTPLESRFYISRTLLSQLRISPMLSPQHKLTSTKSDCEIFSFVEDICFSLVKPLVKKYLKDNEIIDVGATKATSRLYGPLSAETCTSLSFERIQPVIFSLIGAISLIQVRGFWFFCGKREEWKS